MLLRDKDRAALVQIFSAAEVPMEVWAYGSRVAGTAHEGSDLDLVVRSQNLKPLPNDTFMKLKDNIQDSTIPILVELRDWALLPESFHKNILKQYEVLFSNIGQTVNETGAEYRKNRDGEVQDEGAEELKKDI
jgi:uncharacterized protein